jgi:thiosulfate reductase cytochrome b subunit
MKDTKTEQLLWLFLGYLFTAGMLFFVADSTVSVSLSITFTGIVGAFLGVDIAAMIKKTAMLPPGSYKAINKHRYIISLAIFALLILEAFFLSSSRGRNCDALYASFGVGFLIVVGGLVAAVEGNKIVTGETRPTPSPLRPQGQTVNGNGNIVAGGDIT